MKIKQETLKCAVFLGIDVKGVFKPGGTGFLLGVPYEKDKTQQHTYLVTAKHNIQGGCNAFSVNTKDGKNQTIQFPATQRWYDHPSEPADVCLCPIEIGEDWDVLILPVAMITPAEMLGNDEWITNGSDVFITGLFVDTPGEVRNRPIVRRGHIAMIPAEKIHTAMGEIEAYLIEARSVNGLSGSPVFWTVTSDDLDMSKVFELQGVKSPRGIKPMRRMEYWGLLGLIQGHFRVAEDEDREPQYDKERDKKEGVINAGIAAVTPALKVLDVLNCDELSKQRDEIEAKHTVNEP